MIMKKLIYSLLTVVLAGVAFSCEDASLDPLETANVKKGTILALRGTQLDNIYYQGLPGAELFPRAIEGTETFDFDAEFLAEDPNTLESFDIYVEKKVGGDIERVLVKTVSASEFKTTDDYIRPWVSVSIKTTDILAAIGIPDYTDPSVPDILLTTYKFGINITSDINLTDGTIIPAEEIIAAGLFQSNQFYPAQKLVYTMTDYCPEDLEGTYSYSTVVTAVGDGGDLGGCDPGGVTGDGELIAIARGKYSISDVTFGQYDCAWADDPATGATLVNTCDLLTFGGADQYSLVYTITGAAVSPDGTQLSFKWSNDYGDKGTTTLTRTDSKLWPTTLYSD